jgi:hypothetical protein
MKRQIASEVDVLPKWKVLVVAIAAVGTALVSSVVSGHVQVAYPGSLDCQQGCDLVAGGWPFLYLVDNPGISPRGSISLTDGLLGVDIIRLGAFGATLLFWTCAWGAFVWTLGRANRARVH